MSNQTTRRGTLDYLAGDEVAKAEAKSIQDTEAPATLLTTEEKALLKKHEGTIKAGLKTFHDVGMAFAEIRDKGLYREYGTFDDYCHEVWKFSRSKAYRYMAAAKCVENLECSRSATNEPLAIPATETQARKIAKMKSEEQVEVAKNVARKTSTPTAKDFDDEIDNMRRGGVVAGKVEEEPIVLAAFGNNDSVSFVELYEIALEAYNIHSNSNKRKELEKLLYKLKSKLKELAEAQTKLQEAA